MLARQSPHDHTRSMRNARQDVLRPAEQAATEQRPHKLSYSLSAKGAEAKAVLTRLEEALESKGIKAKVIYSGGEDVDVLAAGASKGKGLEFLLQQVHLSCCFVFVYGRCDLVFFAGACPKITPECQWRVRLANDNHAATRL